MVAVPSVGGRMRRGRAVAVGAALVLTAVSALLAPLPPGVAALRELLLRSLLATATVVVLGLGVPAARAAGGGAARRALALATAAVLPLALWFASTTDARVRAATVSVVLAVGVSMLLFVGANLWFDQSARHWVRFSGISGAVVLALIAAVLIGNRQLGLFVGGVRAGRDLSWLLAVLLAALGGAFGTLLARAPSPRARLLIGTVGGAAIGVVLGAFLRPAAWPAPRLVPLVAAPLIGAMLGAVLARLRRTAPVRGALVGATLGWIVGAWLLPDVGRGTALEAVVAAAVTGLGAGAILATGTPRDVVGRSELLRRARVAIFLGPALLFIGVTLLIPTVRTVFLSFRDRRGFEPVGLANYRSIIADPNFLTFDGWTSMVTRGGFLVATVLVAAGALLAVRARRVADGVTPPLPLVTAAAMLGAAVVARLARGQVGPAELAPRTLAALALGLVAVGLVALGRYLRRDRGNTGLAGPGGGVIAAGAFIASFAVFAALRGTLMNNLWWVLTVTTLSTGLGLAIAAIADRSRGETVAKSIIFMPMAISFVGAGIIWRFMFIARPPGDRQTGVLNAVWAWLGRLSTGPARLPAALLLAALAALLVVLAVRAARAGEAAIAGGAVTAVLPLVWLAWRLLGPGLGGVAIATAAQGEQGILLFLQTSPYNNVWMMVPFTWIYTGFSMVIFSSAIKGVPADLLEAGRVDGATEGQMFWRVIVPQIMPTIGVVVTTIIVVVTKVFDIVKVMTNGSFGTQVLANDMWNRSFSQANFGQGSAIATILFLSVLPVMYVNVRRMQREAR